MFYKMIERARERWYASPNCTVKDLVDYMTRQGKLRDAQIDAIKTYLFLKIGCENKPLSVLFSSGRFNTLNLDDLEISNKLRSYLSENPAAAALYEYSCLTNGSNEQLSSKMTQQIRTDVTGIQYKQFFQKAFYGISYTDYLFSLPMGAGKTYLMAAFIYLDLYFASNEPHNPAFAHNFIVLAPSGLKSSVVPSLKTIQKFDPAWVIPEPAASGLKRQISFEVLDQGKTVSKSNKVKNPNVQKIASHQPFSELMGLVAVTNAEKVILDRIEETNGQLSIFDEEKNRLANELRSLIGQLPGLAIFIDEVHHAVSDEIKLRAVVNHWAENDTVNSVIGFSGTPYLEKAEKIPVTDKFSISSAEIANTVCYYPLISGVGNFLKRPVVKISNVADSRLIIEDGVREFLNTYKDKVYAGGLTAKLGIYCGTIEKLEETVYPLVSKIAAEYRLPSDVILKFHKGNKQFPQPSDSQMQFETLDKSFSKIRIILLVQIGKEGWDCRSLTGIILSQEGDCPKNMVLQTSCRCLRQVEKGSPETALIYLNESNAEKLNAQLEQQHRISLKEFQEGNSDTVLLHRYDRTQYLKLPKVNFYQLRVNYITRQLEPADPTRDIPKAGSTAKLGQAIIKTTDLTMEPTSIQVDDTERGIVPATFHAWLLEIVKGGFGTLTMAQLKPYEDALRTLFDMITFQKDGSRFYSSKYDRHIVDANVRKAFCDHRGFTTTEELIPQESSLLNIAHFSSIIYTSAPEEYYPGQDLVERILSDDQGKLKPTAKDQQMITLAEETENPVIAEMIRKKYTSHPQKNRSFHYLPYHTDSSFEQTFLEQVLAMAELENLGLEIYYNGDRAMTEFKIKCYARDNGTWEYIGMYTPDFLIIKRENRRIHKAIIVETKGAIYANDPNFQGKRSFMEQTFVRQNNKAFGYERFDYLYLEDSLSETKRIQITHEKICDFFRERIDEKI